MINIAYEIILQRKNTCDNGIAKKCLGDIGETLPNPNFKQAISRQIITTASTKS